MKKGILVFTIIALSAILVLAVGACAKNKAPDKPDSYEFGKLTVTFEFEKQSGYASNQFAVWIEDMDGKYIDTLYATRFTADGGYQSRPDSLSTWVKQSGVANMENAAVDAISGATPQAGTLSYAWDLMDAEGKAVPHGEYRFFVEGSLRWKNRVVYSDVIALGDEAVTEDAKAEFIYEASDDQAALSDDSPESRMITAVKASFVPATPLAP